ncbi:hypothetical protein [Actinokineospora diospyrosa]|uniref:Alpha/beta hydrolase family protein DUF900 n=1 Tax=Actinokineospora diospyrosa TaxID=103728 RepID=A0ABT1I8N4_9PSEU|nr:hypothetical protein [Actinokineospora diospyrosa]MCP2268992.1 Alpha/beta hydrolase of unknown function (DUF900) [Actinokineospora diospyrosa]
MSRVVLDLDAEGNPVDPTTGQAVRGAAVAGFLDRHLAVPETATDIVVLVHGWRNTPATALARAERFIAVIDGAYGPRYPALPWACHYVIVRWPSQSSPFLRGYRRVRDRAHLMSTTGHAADVLAQLLGYLNTNRTRPNGTLRTAGGQYLHLIGHSFGCRFLAEAIQWAAESRPGTLGWNRADPRYPYAADTLVLFQMAAPHDSLTQRFPRLVADSPIAGPVVLTHATTDRAVGLWHRLAESTPGVGFRGATLPPDQITPTRLHRLDEPYTAADFPTPVVNVDATWRFRKGHRLLPAGAHADIIHPESAHLILSLAHLAR